jgi:hypothetical protein
MWRKVTLFLLIIVLIFLVAGYAALAESFLVWLFWNHCIATIWPAPLINYLQCAAFLILPNFAFIAYKTFILYKDL